MEPLLLTINQTRQALNLGRTTIYELIQKKRLAVVKVGSRTMIQAESVRRIAEEGAETQN